jgi:putative addiction module component (TIGR02574 family)
MRGSEATINIEYKRRIGGITHMSGSLDQLKSDLLQLPADQRAELAHVLIHSLDDDADAGAEAAWDAELARRIDEIDRGVAQGEPAETVFARLREKRQ